MIRQLPILDPNEVAATEVAAIDVTESGHQRYQYVDGQLQIVEQAWQRPFWDRARWEQTLIKWADQLKPDLYLGAYDGARMVGIAGLRYRLTPSMAQLTSLYVDSNYRRQGVASQLVDELFQLTRASGAEAIYVSAKPSVAAVHFYMRCGFRVTSDPHPTLFAQEPLDIHMICALATTL